MELRVADPVTKGMLVVDDISEAIRVREDLIREYVRTYSYE
jgi:hypothetical protein